ncbi:uncharacterized protein LOC34618786 [Cyclospora cayetanensis]|uniref:Dipeptidyl peptidase 1 n=1 Tax=Cyclospora cayetanensis TaxID=88456 RepID=A0A6P6RZE3_9EIME|nr:uncharacterized protein LOC34618786 [Cyclospora cayetanensis]
MQCFAAAISGSTAFCSSLVTLLGGSLQVLTLGVALFLVRLPWATADLPPHCLAKHVVGKWEVHEGLWQPCQHTEGEFKELHDPTCGHVTPDELGTHEEKNNRAWSLEHPCPLANICVFGSSDDWLYPHVLGENKVYQRHIHQEKEYTLTPPNISSTFRESRVSVLTLRADFTAEFDDGSSGYWTMVYDEGLHVEVTAPKRIRLFSFFKYQFGPKGSNTALSFCHTLMVGWVEHVPYQEAPETLMGNFPPTYGTTESKALATPDCLLRATKHTVSEFPSVADIASLLSPLESLDSDESRKSSGIPRRTCWWATKIGEDLSRPTNIVPAVRKSPIELPNLPHRKDPEISRVTVRSRIHSILHGAFTTILCSFAPSPFALPTYAEELLSRRGLRVAAGKKSWEPTDEDYVVLNGKQLRTLDELNEEPGAPRLKPLIEPSAYLAVLSAFSRPSVPVGPPGSSADEPIWKGIMEFDWTNPDHVFMRLGRRQNVVPDAPNQGDCGSCYAITTSTILTSRLWIRYSNNDDIFGKVHVSALQGTACNVYNQGCAGGYVYLALKFGHEHAFRTKECVDYYEKSMNQHFPPKFQQCHDLGGQLGTAVYNCAAPPPRNRLPDACSIEVRVSNWHYVGGTFGSCSAEEMQRELWERGPLAVSIEPSADFTSYSQGVFQSPYDSIVQEGENWSWEKVDHAVVIVGWGWAKEGDAWLPYWKIRNSWGPTWGEGGYARVVRGINEMAIERVAVSADVLLYKNGQAVFPQPSSTAMQVSASSTASDEEAEEEHQMLKEAVQGQQLTKSFRQDAEGPSLLYKAVAKALHVPGPLNLSENAKSPTGDKSLRPIQKHESGTGPECEGSMLHYSDCAPHASHASYQEWSATDGKNIWAARTILYAGPGNATLPIYEAAVGHIVAPPQTQNYPGKNCFSRASFERPLYRNFRLACCLKLEIGECNEHSASKVPSVYEYNNGIVKYNTEKNLVLSWPKQGKGPNGQGAP